MSAISETVYEERVAPELRGLLDALDALDDNDDLDDNGVEAELQSGILTLEFRDGSRYVINAHRAARQLWMAAEHNAWHFDWLPGKRQWIAAKSGEELWATLSRVIGNKLGHAVELKRK